MTATAEQVRLIRADRRKRFGLLLVAIIAAFAVQGIASPSAVEQLIVSVLLGATVVLSFRVAEAKRKVMIPITIFAAALVLVSFAEAIAGKSNGSADRIANLLLVVLCPGAIAVGTVRTLRARNQVTMEAVFGVLSLYILLGMFFAQLYGFLGRVNGAFFAQNVPATVSRCLYFSFTTLTTVGYGDYTAASNLGHTLAVSEALIGQIYLVTVVSLIVGNLGRRRALDPSPPAPAAEQP
jgi:hypothetical protein